MLMSFLAIQSVQPILMNLRHGEQVSDRLRGSLKALAHDDASVDAGELVVDPMRECRRRTPARRLVARCANSIFHMGPIGSIIAPTVQLDEMRKAFFAGALHLFASIMIFTQPNIIGRSWEANFGPLAALQPIRAD